MRIILYTGKGGVGKTSISAATACKIADLGKKVLIMSTDEAHSLSDSFGVKLGNEEREIRENLYGMEIDVVKENEIKWGGLKDYIKKLLSIKSEQTIESDELLVFPGFEELLALIKIKEIKDSNKYDVLIVDCAPTGETMSLLKFPDLFRWWMEKFFPLKRKGAKIAKPIIEKTMKVPMPDNEIFDEIEELYEKIDELHKIMMDKDNVSIRIVTTAEKIVVKEAKRSFSYLHLFDYNVDGVIINKIFPEESTVGYFEQWINIQKESIEEIKNSFKDIPIFKCELMKKELREYDVLKEASDKIYNELDPSKVLFNKKIFSLEKEEDCYKFIIDIPFVDKNELELLQNGDELTVSIKNEKRIFSLPQKLKSKEIIKAKYENESLNIYFK